MRKISETIGEDDYSMPFERYTLYALAEMRICNLLKRKNKHDTGIHTYENL